MTKSLVSICIPTYHYNGHQERLLKRLIKSVREQTYENIELVVSDQDALSENEQYLHEFLDGKIKVKYLAFEDKSGISAHNTNNAISHATGDLIHILNSDDFYYHENALRDMVALLEQTGKGWLAAACLHTDANETKLERVHVPRWNGEKNMVEGINTVGAPSVVLYKRHLNLKCDPAVVYAMDADLWIQAFRASGEPAILPSVAVVIRMWQAQFSSKINIPKQLELDKAMMRKKYEKLDRTTTLL